MERPLLPTLSFSPRSSERVDKAIGPQAETCLLFNSGERLADMSDVEENNFEGRVSTKPREPSSAAARCSGFHGDGRGRAGLRGVLRGPAGSSLWSHRGCFLSSQDGFWVPLLPQTPWITPSPFFLESD